jgi:hypothetical protein
VAGLGPPGCPDLGWRRSRVYGRVNTAGNDSVMRAPSRSQLGSSSRMLGVAAGSFAGGAVDALTQKIEVATVSGRFFDHVGQGVP